MGYARTPVRDIVQEELLQAVQDFYRTSDHDRARELLKTIDKKAKKKGKYLIYCLLSGRQVTKGIGDIEIEMKLTVPEIPGSLKSLLESKKFDETRFIENRQIQERKGTNHYFGTNDEERFVVIQNRYGQHLKVKGPVQPYCLGIDGEEFVLRRDESLTEVVQTGSDTDVLSVTKLVVGLCDPTDTQYRGFFEKEKATQEVISFPSGRLYTVVLSRCTTKKREPLIQLEIEYAGYISGFPDQNNIESERRIVQEILDMANQLELEPTTLTKFEWLMDIEPVVEEPVEDESLEEDQPKGQVFFGRTM